MSCVKNGGQQQEKKAFYFIDKKNFTIIHAAELFFFMTYCTTMHLCMFKTYLVFKRESFALTFKTYGSGPIPIYF